MFFFDKIKVSQNAFADDMYTLSNLALKMILFKFKPLFPLEHTDPAINRFIMYTDDEDDEDDGEQIMHKTFFLFFFFRFILVDCLMQSALLK